MTVLAQPHRVVFVADDGGSGARIKARREALGMTKEDLAALAKVHRNTVGTVEKGGQVRPESMGKLLRALGNLEDETGATTSPDLVTNTIELPDGTRVTFAGPADGVAAAAARFLAEHGA